jgi:hypothetical protein
MIKKLLMSVLFCLPLLPSLSDELSVERLNKNYFSVSGFEIFPEKCLSNLQFIQTIKKESPLTLEKFYLDENCNIKFIIPDIGNNIKSSKVALEALLQVGQIGLFGKTKAETLKEIVQIYYGK